MNDLKPCKKCYYWKDYTERFYGVYPGVETDIGGNRIEFRFCKFSPAPSLNLHYSPIYTPENFTCSEWKEEK